MRFALVVLVSIQPLLANLHLRTAATKASTNAAGVQVEAASGASLGGGEPLPSRSTFAKVLNVVVHPYFHQVELFASIEKSTENFWGTIYMSPSNHHDEFMKTLPTPKCEYDLDGQHGDRTYVCVGQFLRRLVDGTHALDPAWARVARGRPLSEIEGALVHHADFWVGPRFAAGLPRRNSIWHMESHCTRHPEAREESWGFVGQIQMGLLNRIPLLYQAIGHPAGKAPVEVCCSNADLYYLSVDAWSKFADIVQRVWTPAGTTFNDTRDMFLNEVVLPLTMKALKDSGLREEQLCWQKKGLGLGQQQWGSDNTSPACCWGGWNGKPKGDMEIIKNHFCGHKLNLQDNATMQTYKELWTQ